MRFPPVRPLRRRSALAVLWTVAVACAACSEVRLDGPRAAADPRLDLTQLLPTVEDLAGNAAAVEPYQATPGDGSRLRFDSAIVVADRALGTGLADPRSPHREDLRLGAKARTVEHTDQLALAWRLTPELGSLMTFRAAVPDSPDCLATYRLAVRQGGDTTAVFESEVAGGALWESAESVLELSPWSGREIELVASGLVRPAAAGAECSAETLGWISPVVWNRTPRQAAKSAKPNVLLIGLDTVRADHLGAWGRSPSPTPALDRLAAESDVFGQAFSTFNVTNPSFASILTGLYGKHHGIYDLEQPLPEEAVTWAEILGRSGYVTQAVVAATHLEPPASGLGQGFDGVHQPWGQFAAEEVVRRGLQWLDGFHDQGYPFFLWLHFFDAHTPHLPPLPFALGLAPRDAPGLDPVVDWRELRPPGLLPLSVKRVGANPELYTSELAYLDREIGKLLDSLERRGLLEVTWIVVVADHGENLTEHGLTCRHAGLWDTTTHVPLLIRPPAPRGRQGHRFDGLVQTVDIFPTILRGVGIEPPASDGLDLYELAAAGGRSEVFAEHAHGTGAMIRTRTHSYFRQSQDAIVKSGTWFYDLVSDPRQEHNLAGRGLAAEHDLAARLDAWLEDADAPPRPAGVLDPEARERLRALGYLED